VEFAEELIEAFKSWDPKNPRNLSDRIMVEGFIQKNKDLIRLAIVSHALGKILEKDYYKRDRNNWNAFTHEMLEGLKELARGGTDLGVIEKAIIKFDEHFGRYKDNVLENSKIRKGSTLYAWGVSLTLASDMVGVSERELLSQIGRTKIVDEEEPGVSVSNRMKNAEEGL
jgi:CRISPR/Cas system-associated endonuclease Cas3-HD